MTMTNTILLPKCNVTHAEQISLPSFFVFCLLDEANQFNFNTHAVGRRKTKYIINLEYSDRLLVGEVVHFKGTFYYIFIYKVK